MRVIKEIVKEVLKIFIGIIWILSFWLGYIFMSIPEVMIKCFIINTACIVIMYCMLKDLELDKTEEDKEKEVSMRTYRVSKECDDSIEEKVALIKSYDVGDLLYVLRDIEVNPQKYDEIIIKGVVARLYDMESSAYK